MLAVMSEIFQTLLTFAIGFAVALFVSMFTDLGRRLARRFDWKAEVTQAFQESLAKSAGARLDATSAEQAMSLLSKMATAELFLNNWQISAWHRLDELAPDESIEDIGLRDLKAAILGSTEAVRHSMAASVLLGASQTSKTIAWAKHMHAACFELGIVYRTSQKIHAGKDAADPGRSETVGLLIKQRFLTEYALAGDCHRDLRAALRSALRLGPDESLASLVPESL